MVNSPQQQFDVSVGFPLYLSRTHVEGYSDLCTAQAYRPAQFHEDHEMRHGASGLADDSSWLHQDCSTLRSSARLIREEQR